MRLALVKLKDLPNENYWYCIKAKYNTTLVHFTNMLKQNRARQGIGLTSPVGYEAETGGK